jgi:hypothetical protein
MGLSIPGTYQLIVLVKGLKRLVGARQDPDLWKTFSDSLWDSSKGLLAASSTRWNAMT